MMRTAERWRGIEARRKAVAYSDVARPECFTQHTAAVQETNKPMSIIPDGKRRLLVLSLNQCS